MDTDGSIGGRRRGAKTYGKASRRIWSTQEEEVLLECLRDIVRSGWKCDNGFRTGYLGVVEQLIRKKCPESGWKSNPHISSKFMFGRGHMLVSLICWPEVDTNALADDHDFMNSFTQSTAHLNAVPFDTERVSLKKRKKSISTVDEKFDAKFDTFVSGPDNRLGDLAKRFGAEQDESHARRQVCSAEECMSDLTIEQKCVASNKLVNNKNDLDLFLSM
ncbi:UNVERIFIED_CONTAM: hypothetical protein Sradi_3813100 [Sesamum radiatum]|uniref:Myb/SANT-like domain-containing protein n=1 Tax=Sesamum radiatum TaxID=300843 RepID=A0AAW2Q0E1_SESRA